MMKKIAVVLLGLAGALGTHSRAEDVPDFVAQQKDLHASTQEAEWTAYLNGYRQKHGVSEDTYASVYVAWPSWESDHSRCPAWVGPFVKQLVKDLRVVKKLAVQDSDQAYNDFSLGGSYQAVRTGFEKSKVIVILGTPEFNNACSSRTIADTELGSAIRKEEDVKRAGCINGEVKWCVLSGTVEQSLPMNALGRYGLTISPVLLQGMDYKTIVESILSWVLIESPKNRAAAWAKLSENEKTDEDDDTVVD